MTNITANMPTSCQAAILHGSMKMTPNPYEGKSGPRKPDPRCAKTAAPMIEQAVITAASRIEIKPEKSTERS